MIAIEDWEYLERKYGEEYYKTIEELREYGLTAWDIDDRIKALIRIKEKNEKNKR